VSTKQEQDWFNKIQELGCIVCLNEELGRSPSDVHHLHRNGNRRVDHFHTIPLCYLHHRQGGNCEQYVSRHPWKKEFEKRYGSEWDLFKQVKSLIESQADHLYQRPV
jgi:hypothetical protein